MADRLLTNKQRDALVDLIMRACHSGTHTVREIHAYVLRYRETGRRSSGYLSPTDLANHLGPFLQKLVSGGRLGIVYYRKEQP